MAPASSETSKGTVRLIALTALCVVLLGVVYVVAVRTGWGQRLDNTAVEGRTTRPAALRATGRVLDTISVASLALGGIAISFVAIVRGRLHLAITAGAVLLVANLGTQLLKNHLLTRPVLAPPNRLSPSFPSGHATVAMSLVVALILVVPARARGLTAIAGLGYACLVGTGVVTAGWHRPSDVIGGFLVAVGCGASAAGALLAWRGADTRRGGSDPSRTRVLNPMLAGGGIVLLGIGFVGFAGTYLALRQNRLSAVKLSGSYAAALIAIVGVGLLLVAALMSALRGVVLDPLPAVTNRAAAPRGRAPQAPSPR